MFSHVTIGTDDPERAAGFYTPVLRILNIEPVQGPFRNGARAWRKSDGTAMLWLLQPHDGQLAARGNGWMVAIEAPSRAAVDEAYAIALDLGGTDEGSPGIRPHSFAPDYYGAYVRDPNGNKLHFVHSGDVSFKKTE